MAATQENQTDGAIPLHAMEQLAEAIDVDDVWTGRTDPAARRKRQNRLNQRAYRKRRAQLEYQSSANGSNGELQPRAYDTSGTVLQSCATVSQQKSNMTLRPIMPYVKPGQQAVIFPLPHDHLLTLVQYNVLRAMIINMDIMSLLGTIPAECGGIWQVAPTVEPHNLTQIPPCLLPTSLQLSTPHAPWIDVLPSGRFRDNVIMAIEASSFDEDDFCCDVVGGLFEGFADVELRGVVAWDVPWHSSGWEVSEGFLRKWGHLLRGCKDLAESTNKWRTLRSEDGLVWEV